MGREERSYFVEARRKLGLETKICNVSTHQNKDHQGDKNTEQRKSQTRNPDEKTTLKVHSAVGPDQVSQAALLELSKKTRN